MKYNRVDIDRGRHRILSSSLLNINILKYFSSKKIAPSPSPSGVTRMPISSRSTALNGIPDEPTADTLANQAKAERWNEIRLLSDEEAQAQLSGDELESYTGYHAEVKEGIEKLQGIAQMMLKSLEPPRVKPKGKKQRKRDKWAKTKAIAEARAAEAI